MQVRTREHILKEIKTGENNIFKKYRALILNIGLIIIGSICMIAFPFDFDTLGGGSFFSYVHFMLYAFSYTYLSFIFLCVFYFTLIFLGKLFIKVLSGELQKYIASKIIFIGGGINFTENVEIIESQNMRQSMNYYNSKKLKNDFKSYFFWKNIGDACKIFLATYLIIFFILIFSFTQFSSIIFPIITSLFIVSPIFYKFLLTLKNIETMQIKTLSFSPKNYVWKDKNTLYFK